MQTMEQVRRAMAAPDVEIFHPSEAAERPGLHRRNVEFVWLFTEHAIRACEFFDLGQIYLMPVPNPLRGAA